MANPTIQQLAADLAAGRTSSRRLTEEALARIEDPKGEGSRGFIRVWRSQALAAADASDALRKAGLVPSPLAGLPVSIACVSATPRSCPACRRPTPTHRRSWSAKRVPT